MLALGDGCVFPREKTRERKKENKLERPEGEKHPNDLTIQEQAWVQGNSHSLASLTKPQTFPGSSHVHLLQQKGNVAPGLVIPIGFWTRLHALEGPCL